MMNMAGNTTHLVDRNGIACSMSYDKLGRLVKTAYSNGTEDGNMYRIEDAKKMCWWKYFPDAECEGVEPERLNRDNFVEKSLEGYERELQRLGIDRGLGTLDVIKRYIEVMGGIDRKMLD